MPYSQRVTLTTPERISGDDMNQNRETLMLMFTNGLKTYMESDQKNKAAKRQAMSALTHLKWGDSVIIAGKSAIIPISNRSGKVTDLIEAPHVNLAAEMAKEQEK